MLRKWDKSLLLLVLVAGVSAPAGAGGINYDLDLRLAIGYTPPALPSTFAGPLKVAVLDSREPIVSGSHPPTYVGATRTGWGIPLPVGTASGHPLADDMAKSIAAALRTQGADATPVVVSPSRRRDEALAAVAGSRALLVELRTWESDGYARIGLTYDARAVVVDERGRAVGEGAVAGEDFVVAKQAKSANLPAITRSVLRTLLSSPQVVAGLAGQEEPASASCTTEQILKLKQAGMSDAQVLAACGGGA